MCVCVVVVAAAAVVGVSCLPNQLFILVQSGVESPCDYPELKSCVKVEMAVLGFQSLLLLFFFIHSFYIALFSALEQTHCAHWHVILNWFSVALRPQRRVGLLGTGRF